MTQTAKSCSAPDLVRWVCVNCQDHFRGKTVPKYCYNCGMVQGYAAEDIPILGTRSSELGQLKPGVFVDDWSLALRHGLPLGCSIVLRGRPGAGKSRAGYRLGAAIGSCMAFGLEMGKTLSCVTAESAGANMANFWWYEDLDGLKDLPHLNPSTVVIDSIQKLGRARARIVSMLRKWALDNQRNVILVSQLNTKGKSRHGEDDDFDCDLLVDVTRCKNDGVMRQEIHGLDATRTPCQEGCAHIEIAKSRVCNLVALDVPIVGDQRH